MLLYISSTHVKVLPVLRDRITLKILIRNIKNIYIEKVPAKRGGLDLSELCWFEMLLPITE
jgi:hypothetical protein